MRFAKGLRAAVVSKAQSPGAWSVQGLVVCRAGSGPAFAGGGGGGGGGARGPLLVRFGAAVLGCACHTVGKLAGLSLLLQGLECAHGRLQRGSHPPSLTRKVSI